MRKNFRSILLLILGLSLLMTLLGGCKKEEEQTTEVVQESITKETVVEPIGPSQQDSKKEESSKSQKEVSSQVSEEEAKQNSNQNPNINPLTGELEDHPVASKRPVAFMINNIWISVPQVGVSEADIIFEALVEGGITRMMCVYQEIPDDIVIGSVRSLRHSYIDLAAAYDAIIAHCGGSNLADNVLARRGYDDIEAISWAGDLFYRDPWRTDNMGYEHSLMTTGKAINGFLADAPFHTEHEADYQCSMVFSEDPKVSGGDVKTNVDVDFGSDKHTYFTFHAETNDYTAVEYDEPYIDDATDEEVLFKNIVVIITDVWVCDDAGHQDMTLTGSGEGWFCVNGVAAPITWSRTDEDAQFVYTYLDGTPVTFGVGRT
ncbi:MAG: DUF3048 domain-containing protein, partial [Firmicutes bacterium]|nr:DUF3048 domain-containing protein [Bacillota bacterium]